MKERHLPPKYVAAAFNRRFPDAPICRPADSPEKRAAAAMKAAKVTPAMRTRVEKGEIMDVFLKEPAMAVFATTQVVFALYVHEVVFFVFDADRIYLERFNRKLMHSWLKEDRGF
ncbi:unnamed protein product [Ectocarpus sp. CCAP 1310/34]|nr:unnamed protein product [Ectocarpus sp. CCAP 1310/34]